MNFICIDFTIGGYTRSTSTAMPSPLRVTAVGSIAVALCSFAFQFRSILTTKIISKEELMKTVTLSDSRVPLK